MKLNLCSSPVSIYNIVIKFRGMRIKPRTSLRIIPLRYNSASPIFSCQYLAMDKATPLLKDKHLKNNLQQTCTTKVTEVRVTFSHGQEARAVFRLAGTCAASAAGETVGAVHATLAELLTEVVGLDAGAGVVARLARVLARLVVVLVAGGASQLSLDLAMILSPRPEELHTVHPQLPESVQSNNSSITRKMVPITGRARSFLLF